MPLTNHDSRFSESGYLAAEAVRTAADTAAAQLRRQACAVQLALRVDACHACGPASTC
jgi:hypothetical protein